LLDGEVIKLVGGEFSAIGRFDRTVGAAAKARTPRLRSRNSIHTVTFRPSGVSCCCQKWNKRRRLWACRKVGILWPLALGAELIAILRLARW